MKFELKVFYHWGRWQQNDGMGVRVCDAKGDDRRIGRHRTFGPR